jgi:hypothetical protein
MRGFSLDPAGTLGQVPSRTLLLVVIRLFYRIVLAADRYMKAIGVPSL